VSLVDACGRLLAPARQAGRRLGATAALIAAACLACDLALATPDLGDFEELGVELFAP
jgi:predicted nucleic acid-binding protein